MIKPQQTTGQKISSIGGTVGTVLGGLNMVKGLFTNKNDEDRRQLRQQEKLQKLQIGGSKELADYEQELKMKMWNDTNYGAQLAQAEKAGVSKAAAIGGSGTGTQGASVGGTTGGQAADAAQTEANAINKQMMMAQVANMQANTAKTVEETKDIAGVGRETKGKELEGIGYDNEVKNATVNAEIKRIQYESDQELEKLAQDRNNTYISNETYKEEVKQVNIETILRRLETKAKAAGIKLTEAQIRNIDETINQNWEGLRIKDNEAGIKEFEANMRAQDPSLFNVIGGEVRRSINMINDATGAKDGGYYRYKKK